jgi:hypothetical protein
MLRRQGIVMVKLFTYVKKFTYVKLFTFVKNRFH